MPSTRHVRATRTAISPRFAIRILRNRAMAHGTVIRRPAPFPGASGKRGPGGERRQVEAADPAGVEGSQGEPSVVLPGGGDLPNAPTPRVLETADHIAFGVQLNHQAAGGGLRPGDLRQLG